jgi:putative salt-induced outer membrane protein
VLRYATIAAVVLATASVAGAQSAKPTTSFTGDLGYVSATGNTRLSTLNVGDKIVHTDGLWTFTQTAAYVNGQTKGVESANQFTVTARTDYAFMPRLSLFAGASYDRNPFAGYNRRINELLGVRWKAVVAPQDSLDLDAGGALTQQTDVSDSTENFVAARVAASYKHSFSKAAYFQQNVEYLPDLQTSGAYRLNTLSSVVAPVSAHIGIKVSYQIQYNSKPPATFGTTDRLLTTGVQVTF